MSTKRKKYLIFGGTGSLGTTLTRRLLEDGHIVGIFSRDEAKNFRHRREFSCVQADLQYFIGDIREYLAVFRAINEFKPDVIIHAAAMKQVPLCEDFPQEAVKTNVLGTENIANAAQVYTRWASSEGVELPIRLLSISTDKAVKPVNAYGFTKALQERIHLRYNHRRLIANCVRYGNVLESTGSVIPVFKTQLEKGEPLTVTDPDMTRFLLTLDEAVDLIFKALDDEEGGKIFVPELRSAYIAEVAQAMLVAHGRDPDDFVLTGIRPGEKLHEILVSEEECERVVYNEEGKHFEITQGPFPGDYSESDFCSGGYDLLLSGDELDKFLEQKGVIPCVSESQAQTASSARI
jgi:FlaA1/EpsC-like NDP-sugar epimerase